MGYEDAIMHFSRLTTIHHFEADKTENLKISEKLKCETAISSDLDHNKGQTKLRSAIT